MNTLRLLFVGICTLVGLVSTWSLLAAEPLDDKPATNDDKPAASGEDIARWIKELDSDKFATRDRASNRLADSGERAIDAVAAATASESREVATRSIETLKRLMQAPDKSTSEKAKAALEKLAQGENEAAARRAKQALQPTPPIPGPAANPFGQIQIGGGGIPVQGNVQLGGAGNRIIKMQNINGRKTIEVNDNGKKIEIVEDPQQGIDMSITEKINGQDKTEKYAAKDADELKKKHPAAAKIYEQYKGGRIGGGMIAIQVQANGGPGAVPNLVPPRFPPNVPAGPRASRRADRRGPELAPPKSSKSRSKRPITPHCKKPSSNCKPPIASSQAEEKLGR